MVARFIAALVVLVAPSAVAFCGGPGDPACLPDDPLSQPFAAAIADVGCQDTFEVDGSGKVLNPAPDPWPSFAQRYGNLAIPFYESVISRCDKRGGLGFMLAALESLAALGTPRALAALEGHTRQGHTERSTAFWVLLRSRQVRAEQVGDMLLREQETRVRLMLTEWLYAHGDVTALQPLRSAIEKEYDPAVAAALRRALLQSEHPDRCVLEGAFWSWSTWGYECGYTCRGTEMNTRNSAWRGPLPCPDTVSRGAHLGRPRRSWLIPVLLVIGAEFLLRRGVVQGLAMRRARVRRRIATGIEAVYVGLAWCAVSLIPFGAALAIWLSVRR